jgi:tryptophan-rich sensory protein
VASGTARQTALAVAQWRMDIARISAAVAGTALVVGYAVGSGLWVTTGDAWYRSLEQPPWQPPGAVFGIIWPYNFAALIAAGIAVALNGSPAARTVWLVGLALSVTAALTWARLFYVSHSLWPAAIALIAAAVLTAPIVVAAWNTRTWAGAILLPYNVWVALAASLSVGYALRN